MDPSRRPLHPKLLGCTAAVWVFLGGFLGCTGDVVLNWSRYSQTFTGIGETFRIGSFTAFALLGWLVWRAGTALRDRRSKDQ